MAQATEPRRGGPAELAEAPGVEEGRAKPDPGEMAPPAAEGPGSARSAQAAGSSQAA
jgi:hypothetical protein